MTDPTAFDLENPPWSAEPFNGDSDKWGDEQDRSEWFEAAAAYWCARATELEQRLADEQHGRY